MRVGVRASLFLLTALCAACSAERGPRVELRNPYAGVDWGTFAHHKADLHLHTLQSDGCHPPNEVVRVFHEAGFSVLVPEGSYFVTADITGLGGTDGVEFCRDLPARCGVVAVPSQVFYDDVEAGRHLVRFAFCKKPEVIDEAVSRLRKLSGS